MLQQQVRGDAALRRGQGPFARAQLRHAEAGRRRLDERLAVAVALLMSFELRRGELGGQFHRRGVGIAEGEPPPQLKQRLLIGGRPLAYGLLGAPGLAVADADAEMFLPVGQRREHQPLRHAPRA